MLRDDSADPGRRRAAACNVLGEPLDISSIKPTTGFYRDGCCNTGQEDVGSQDKAAYGLRVRGGAPGCIWGKGSSYWSLRL